MRGLYNILYLILIAALATNNFTVNNLFSSIEKKDASSHLLDDEEDGALSIAGLDDLTQLQNADSSTYTFFNPNGYFVTIPETCTKVYLSTLEKFTSQNPLPIGTLVGFKNENGDFYEVKRHSQGYIFYQCDQTQDIYIDSLTAQITPTEGIFGVTYVDNASSHQDLGNILAKITSSYFKAPSPIGQTTYTAQNETPFYKFFLYGEQYISASEYNVLTPQSFINKLKTGNEVKIVEQFNVLHNGQINLNAFDYFGGSRNPIDFLRQEFDENTTIKEYVVFYDFINTPLIELASQISCLDQIISEENGAYKTLIMEQVGPADFNDPINNIQTIHESIEEAILRYDDVNTIAAEVPTNGLQPLLDHAENLNYHCFFDALSYDNRVIVLDAVIKDDDYWWYDDINLLNELFVNASSVDQIKLIKKLKTDNWLQELNDQVFEWDDIRDDLDFEALQEFFASVTPVFIENYDQFTVTHQTKTITAQGQTQSIVLNNVPGSALHSNAPFTLDMPATYTYQSNYNEYPVFIGEHEGLYNIYDALNTMPDAFKESIFAKLDPSNDEVPFTFENGKYTVNCKYQLSSYDENVMPLDHQQESSDPDNIFLYMQDEYTLDPFEFVELHFTSTYGSQNIEVGTSIVVPAFEMFMYDRAVGLHKTQWISRLVLDAVEITVGALAYLSAPATFGGSVAAFTAIVAAIDAAVTYDRNNPNYTLDQYNDPFYNNWDAFKTATDLTALGVGSIQAFKAVGGIIKNRKAIAVACMLNYNIRRTKSIVNGVSGLDNSRHFLYLESLRLGRSLDDVEDAFVFPSGFVGGLLNAGIKARIITKLDDLGDLTHAKNFVNSLDETADAALLGRIDNLDDAQLQGLDDFYKTRKSPQGFSSTDYNFTTSKSIDGNSVLVTYKYGVPDFRSHSPVLNYTDGSPPSKFKYQSNNLNGCSPDFTAANSALAKKFGIEKAGGNWPWENGYLSNGNFRIAQTNSGKMSQQFELFENGDWVKYTWHHYEDGRTMFPVKSSIHSVPKGFNHSGGRKIILKDLQGVFLFTGF